MRQQHESGEVCLVQVPGSLSPPSLAVVSTPLLGAYSPTEHPSTQRDDKGDERLNPLQLRGEAPQHESGEVCLAQAPGRPVSSFTGCGTSPPLGVPSRTEKPDMKHSHLRLCLVISRSSRSQ